MEPIVRFIVLPHDRAPLDELTTSISDVSFSRKMPPIKDVMVLAMMLQLEFIEWWLHFGDLLV